MLHPIIVVSYGDEARQALIASLEKLGTPTVACASFQEAEAAVIGAPCGGLLIDLTSIVKAKGDEKIVACTLTNIFPTLRVRTVGSMLVPMSMPGEAKQDGSVNDFLAKTCAAFVPRRLRAYRRHQLCLATLIEDGNGGVRGYTLNISWEGAFVVDTRPERFIVGEEIVLLVPEFQQRIPAEVRWIQPWGGRRQPGIGIRFRSDTELSSCFPGCVIHHPRENDRDRLQSR